MLGLLCVCLSSLCVVDVVVVDEGFVCGCVVDLEVCGVDGSSERVCCLVGYVYVWLVVCVCVYVFGGFVDYDARGASFVFGSVW